MTSSSKARLERRAAAKAEAKVAKMAAYKPGDPAKSIITLTEIPGSPGGFTIGLGLHGARMEELFPGGNHPVSVVDIMALAATQMIRTQPEAFQEAVTKVTDTLRSVHQRLEAGEEASGVMAAADAALGGSVNAADVEGTGDDDGVS